MSTGTLIPVVSPGCWLLFLRSKEAQKRLIIFSESGAAQAGYYVQRARWAPTLGDMGKQDFEKHMDIWPEKDLCYLPTETCIIRVDENFHYGQGLLKGHRFLVYHPTNRQEMKQGRFRSNNVVVAIQDAANMIPEIKAAEVSVKLNPKFFSTLRDAGNKVLGDPLKVFTKVEGESEKLGQFVKTWGKITYTTPALMRAKKGDHSQLDPETLKSLKKAPDTFFKEPQVTLQAESYTAQEEADYNKDMEEGVKNVLTSMFDV